MSVYRKFAAKSIEKHVKKGPVTKPFGQDCSFCLMQYQENDCELFNQRLKTTNNVLFVINN